jgi:4-amino-4-deoxy-L-arabinose transferase-like glycosyltransferase
VISLATWGDLWQWKLITLSEASTQWKGLLRLLLWFTWPAWPLAAWTLWTWRNQWKEHVWQQHLVLPVFIYFVVLIASITTKNPERTLLLSLPPLACLAAFALPTLKRSVAALIDWFTLLFFTGGAVIVWVVWISLQTGWPAQPAINVSRLVPGYVSEFNWFHTVIALIMTAVWCKLILWRLGKNPRFIWKSLVLPASGALLCWVLLMTLWMPLLNYARSYQPLAMQVKSWVHEPQCVYSLGLNRAQIAGLSFHGNLKMVDFEKNKSAIPCEWLIANPATLRLNPAALDPENWTKVRVIRRPADKREDIVLYQRIASNTNE